jgi:hypothetical protein
MDDTRQSEIIAEATIVSKLMAFGIYIAKPYFEVDGGDLIGYEQVENLAYFGRIHRPFAKE